MSKQPKQPTPFETWVIRNKNTGEFFVAPSGKNSWKAKRHAKNAWASLGSGNHYYTEDNDYLADKVTKYQVNSIAAKDRYNEDYWTFPYFDEQDTWELIELGGSVESLGKQLKDAVDILTTLVDEEGHRPIITGQIAVVIKKFLESVK